MPSNHGQLSLCEAEVHAGQISDERPALIWEPAEVMSVTEARLLADEGLMKVIAENRADPSRLQRRDRSAAARA
ncbi:MAG: hypothetical protein ACSLFB_02805 [Acidimicrobiales bacterium]